jgi:hypothetical protein
MFRTAFAGITVASSMGLRALASIRSAGGIPHAVSHANSTLCASRHDKGGA